MSQSLDEEDAVLKDLVSKTLLNNGALGKLQAELRAGVFLALEEEFKDRDVPLCNRRTQTLLASPAGSLAASLVHDFLTCLGLDFSLSVYGPESNLGAGLWNLLNRQELLQHLSLGQDKEPSVPVLLWQCREQQHHATQDKDVASLQKLDARGSAATNEDKTAPLKNNRLNTNKPNNNNSDNNTSQKRNITTNTNDNQSSSHSINNNNKQSSSQSKSDLPEVTTASSSLPVVSKTVTSGAVGSEQNSSAAPAKASKVGARAGAASTLAASVGEGSGSSATSKASAIVSKTTASSNTSNSTEKMVTSKAAATDVLGKIINNKSSDTHTTLTSSSSGGLVSSISKSANISTSSESLQSSKSPLASKTSTTNVKGTTATVASAKSTSQGNEQTLASTSRNALPGVESSSRRPSSSHSRLREAAVLHPPENILSAAPPDTRADSADSSSSASEADLQRLASSVLKGVTAPLGRPRQPLPTGLAKPANRVPKTGLDLTDEPDYGEDEDFSSSSTWSTETKSGEDEGAASSRGPDKKEDPAGRGAEKEADSVDKHTQDQLKAKLRLKSPEDSDPLETEEDFSIGDFSTSESVSGREETEDLSAPPSRSAVVDYDEAL